jgi:N-acetylneuraminate lyase
MSRRLSGLIAATHTPLDAQGQINLPAIETQAAYLVRQGITGVFIGGTTGEGLSLTLEERLALAQRWSEVVRGTPMRWVVHVGSTCLADARELARQAEQFQATAIAALAPSYFKPRDVPALVAWCQQIAAAAPQTPFYYYDIPGLTGVNLPLTAFVEQAREVIPTLAGIKYSNPDLLQLQHGLHLDEGRLDLLWGNDETLLAALALGVHGAVGSSYNFAASIYQRLLNAFESGDLPLARAEQYRSLQLIDTLASFGYLAASKVLMGWLGVPLGPPRLPLQELTPQQRQLLRQRLDQLGFFHAVA